MAKVLHLLDSLNRGGAETLVLDICRNADLSRNELSFAASGTGDLENEFRGLDIPTTFLKRKIPVDPILIGKLRSLIKSTGIEIVHGYQPVEVLHLWLASWRLPVKIVQSFQGGGWFLKSGKDQRVAKFLDRFVDLNISCSYGMLADIENRTGISTDDFEVVYNSVDQTKLDVEKGKLRKELGLGDEAIIGGNVANFVGLNHKNQIVICKALKEIVPHKRDFHFVFVGKTTESGREDFTRCAEFCRQEGIEKQVHFLGQRDDVPEILADLGVFVMSSKHEGLGISAVEAMLAGVPQILSDIPPFLEFSDNGRFAKHFEPDEHRALADELKSFINEPRSLAEVAKEAKLFALKRYSIEAHLAQLDGLYKKLIDMN